MRRMIWALWGSLWLLANAAFGESLDQIYFRIPMCLPHCTMADKDELNTNSFIEQQVVAAIDAAKTSVDFQQFTFSRKSVFDALIRAADRGVIVHGVMDNGQFTTVGKECTPTGCNFTGDIVASDIVAKKPSERLAVIEQKKLWPTGASNSEKLAVLFYQLANGSGVKPQTGKARLMHNKYVLVDSDLLITGSGNWSSTGMGINLENITIMTKAVHPEEVKSFACMNAALWSATAVTEQVRACEGGRVYFSPSNETTGILPTILENIRQSQKSIEISMHHLTHPAIIGALANAATRGVVVRVMVDDDDCIAKVKPELAPLLDAGGQLQYMPTDCAMFQLSHNKFGIFDGKTVVNGSGNWSKGGLHQNYENFIVHTDPDEVRAFQQFYEQVWPMTEKREACTCPPQNGDCRARYCLNRPSTW